MENQKYTSTGVAVIIVLALLAAFIGGFYLLVKAVGIEGSLIWSTLVAAIGWMISEHLSRRREHQKLLAEHKQEMYFEFLDFMLNIMNEVKDKSKEYEPTPDLLRELSRWSLRLTLIGSDEVVKAWNGFRRREGEGNSGEMFATVAKLLSEMRKDCGHYGTKLTGMDLLSVMIKGDELEKFESLLGPTS